MGLNPLVARFFILGRNDVLFFAFLLASFYLLFQRRTTWSFAMLAIACTIKLFAWAFVPFLLSQAIGQARTSSLSQSFRHLQRPLVIFAIIFVAIIGPFAIWNLPAFYDDIIRYTSGTSPTSYPINGLGISTMFLAAGIIKQPTDAYPFWIFQLLTVGPLLWFTLPRIVRRPQLSTTILVGTFTLFVAMFFSRFMNDNYIGLVLLLATAGFGFRQLEANWKQPE
jgi:uncharacterized membrane protein